MNEQGAIIASFPYASVTTSCYVIYATRTYACVQDFIDHN